MARRIASAHHERHSGVAYGRGRFGGQLIGRQRPKREALDLTHKKAFRSNRAFENLTPVAVVREKGLPGLRAGRSYLDNAVGN